MTEDIFIMGQYQIARYEGKGTGKVITKDQMIEIFGLVETEKLIDEMDWYGSAIIK